MRDCWAKTWCTFSCHGPVTMVQWDDLMLVEHFTTCKAIVVVLKLTLVMTRYVDIHCFL